jgi:hypothetical protein
MYSEHFASFLEYIRLKENTCFFEEKDGVFIITTSKKTFVFIPVNFYENYSKLRVKYNKNHVFVWEDIWVTETEKVKNRIDFIFGIYKTIYARKTTVKKVNKPEADSFLINNHLNINTKSATKIGLYYNNELVALATFDKGLKMTFTEKPFVSYNLIRFCNKMGTQVIGGLSKLTHYFVDYKKAVHIVTYVDLDWGNGLGFEKIGFKTLEKTPDFNLYIHKKDFNRVYEHQIEGTIESYYKVSNNGNLKMVLDLRSLHE